MYVPVNGRLVRVEQLVNGMPVGYCSEIPNSSSVDPRDALLAAWRAGDTACRHRGGVIDSAQCACGGSGKAVDVHACSLPGGPERCAMERVKRPAGGADVRFCGSCEGRSSS